jgi:Tfp pilus assembly protein PilV
MRSINRAVRHGRDDGFTLIEIILAMFLTVVAMTALLGVLVSSLKTVTQARQRQTATALATQSLERLRALPYDSVTGSAAATYPKTVGLQYVTTSGTTDTFAPTVLPGVSETLVVNQYSGKLASTTIDGVAYVVQTYVTKPAATAALQQAFNLTALVSWTSTVYPTTRTTAERSTEYSPAGCLSTAQSPFAAPCQAYFTAQAGLSASGFSVTNADDPTLDIPGINGRLVELNLPVLSANLQIEQTASGSAVGGTSAAKTVPGAAAGVGGVSASVAVDSDPSSTPSQQQSASANQSFTSPVSISGTSGTLSATPTSGDTPQGQPRSRPGRSVSCGRVRRRRRSRLARRGPSATWPRRGAQLSRSSRSNRHPRRPEPSPRTSPRATQGSRAPPEPALHRPVARTRRRIARWAP